MWIVNALSIVYSVICSNCQEITKISKCSGSPRTLWLPLVIRDILLLGIITWFTTCHSKQLLVGLMVLSDGIVHFLKIEKNWNKSTKTIFWLLCDAFAKATSVEPLGRVLVKGRMCENIWFFIFFIWGVIEAEIFI